METINQTNAVDETETIKEYVRNLRDKVKSGVASLKEVLDAPEETPVENVVFQIARVVVALAETIDLLGGDISNIYNFIGGMDQVAGIIAINNDAMATLLEQKKVFTARELTQAVRNSHTKMMGDDKSEILAPENNIIKLA